MRYHNITYPDQNNGDGLRVTLWLSGCSHFCYNCQNPQTWDENSGIAFDDNEKSELLQELNGDYISGITFSGGDPLHKNNIEEVFDLINLIREKYPAKTIWLYTGYRIEQISEKFIILDPRGKSEGEEISEDDKLRSEIISNCDVVVDGRYVDSLRDITLKWRGSSNQRVINVKESLSKGEVILWCD